MFLSTKNLKEGGCRDKYQEGIKRELIEGKNPKSANANWQLGAAGCTTMPTGKS